MTPLTDAELDLILEQAHNAQSFLEPRRWRLRALARWLTLREYSA